MHEQTCTHSARPLLGRVSLILTVMIALLMPRVVDAASAPEGAFGVDGLALDLLPVVATAGDGWSGANGLTWERLQPEPPGEGDPGYNWVPLDQSIASFQATGRRLQLNVLLLNPWALDFADDVFVNNPGTGEKQRAITGVKPEHHATLAAFTTALIERYDADGVDDAPGLLYPLTHYQIGSEAENEWLSVEGYLEALKIVYDAAKAASPAVRIMAGGFNAGSGPDDSTDPKAEHKRAFFTGFLAGAADRVDIISLHLSREYETIPGIVAWFRDRMQAAGYAKPIWSDDMHSAIFYHREQEAAALDLLAAEDPAFMAWWREQQARIVVKKSVTAFAAGVSKVFVSADQDWPFYYMPQWRHTGLLDRDGTPRPAFHALQTMVTWLDGFSAVAPLPRPTGAEVATHGYRFIVDGQEVAVFWHDPAGQPRMPADEPGARAPIFGLAAPWALVIDARGNRTLQRMSEVTVDGAPMLLVPLATRWGEAVARGEGWWEVAGLGVIQTATTPWVFHANHGWLYVQGNYATGWTFWDEAMAAWWWTASPSARLGSGYPWLYVFAHDEPAWWWYAVPSVEAPTPGTRWFYATDRAQWLSIGPNR